MALNDVEEEVLNQLNEDLDDAYNWDGETGLREAIADATDELCMFASFFERKVMIGLKADVAFYEISPDNAYSFYIKSARLWEVDRKLECESLIGMAKRDSQWMISRGSPIKYIPIASDIVGFYPFPSSDGDAVELSIVCTPEHYAEGEFVSIREELENSLIHYGKYYLMMREKALYIEALGEYQEYLKYAKMSGALKHHANGMRRYLYGSRAAINR